MIIKIEGFSEVLDILKGLFSRVKSAMQIPEKNRKEMRGALQIMLNITLLTDFPKNQVNVITITQSK